MQCARCQHENPSESNFCLGCGTRLGLPCAACGNELPPGSRFCNKCGHAVGAHADSGQRFASPDTYTPQHLAEKILTSKAALEGERKQVTVLFADLKGSMELLADRDPEEARKLLDPVLERMMEAVHRYEGTVNQVMGDGIMALFGAPLAHEDHAVRACYAALDMQAAMRQYAEEVWRSTGIEAADPRGLNSGEVVVRAIGSDLHMDYTAVGQTTHLAARMEQLATPGTILLTADTLRLAEGYVTVKPLGPVPVKGLEAPVEVYEMTGAGPVRSRLHAAAARGLTRFVGRDAELEQLRAGARAGRSRATARWSRSSGSRASGSRGSSGSSPTRTGPTAGSSSRPARSPTARRRLPAGHRPAEGLLPDRGPRRQAEGPREGDGQTAHPRRGAPSRRSPPSSPCSTSSGGRPVGGAGPAAASAADPRRGPRLLLRESQVQPLLLVFEDLHWIDTETQALLDSLVESLPTARMLLLVNYRPEYEHRWGGKTYYTQLRLDPLPPESAEALLDALLGEDSGLRPLKQLLIERTEGNPFFLEESVRTLVETGALAGERGAYRLAARRQHRRCRTRSRRSWPRGSTGSRPRTSVCSQSAAVIGKDVPCGSCSRPSRISPRPSCDGASPASKPRSSSTRPRLFPDLEYTFKHALTHEVAYGSLLQDRRRACMLQILEIIERLYPDRVAEQVERLAHHALRAEAWEHGGRLCPRRPARKPRRARRTGRRWPASSKR